MVHTKETFYFVTPGFFNCCDHSQQKFKFILRVQSFRKSFLRVADFQAAFACSHYNVGHLFSAVELNTLSGMQK